MLDSFGVAYAITFLRFALWRLVPALWGLISRGAQAGVATFQAAGLAKKCLIIAFIILIACYVATAAWLVSPLDPPLLTSQVLMVGTTAALVAYIGWGVSVMGRTLLRIIDK